MSMERPFRWNIFDAMKDTDGIGNPIYLSGVPKLTNVYTSCSQNKLNGIQLVFDHGRINSPSFSNFYFWRSKMTKHNLDTSIPI